MRSEIAPYLVTSWKATTCPKRIRRGEQEIRKDFLLELLDQCHRNAPVSVFDEHSGPLFSLGREIMGIDNTLTSIESV